jgi:D-alanyl-D-alanine carboxypeptidase
MKRILSALRTFTLAAGVSSVTLLAQAQVAQAPQPPEIAARTYMLLDVTANQVLAAKDIDAPVEQASLTKLMTGYLVFDALRAKKIDLQQKFPVSVRAWKMPGSRMFIDPKMQVPVDDLIKGMIVQSGNDATMALAEGVGGSTEQFVKLMNDQAKALGMAGTSYKNPRRFDRTGPPDHSARSEHFGDAPDARFSGVHALLRHQALQLPRHAAIQWQQPQCAAISRSQCGWLQDRPHNGRGLLLGSHCQA